VTDFKKGPIEGVIAENVKKFIDERGWLAETFRHDEMQTKYFPVMAYTSLTLPEVTRGPHEHEAQSDLFLFIGPGNFKIWLWDNRKEMPTYMNKMVLTGGQDSPLRLLVPPGVVHAYRNISNQDAVVHNFPNQLFMGEGKRQRIDEIRHEDDPRTPFKCE